MNRERVLAKAQGFTFLLIFIGLIVFSAAIGVAVFSLVNDSGQDTSEGYTVYKSSEVVEFEYDAASQTAEITLQKTPEAPIRVFRDGDEVVDEGISPSYPLLRPGDSVELDAKSGETVTLRYGVLFDHEVIGEYEIA